MRLSHCRNKNLRQKASNVKNQPGSTETKVQVRVIYELYCEGTQIFSELYCKGTQIFSGSNACDMKSHRWLKF